MFAAALLALSAAPPDAPLPGFRRSAWFREQVREEWLDDGVRAVANAPERFDPARPTRLLVYATPNGNTIEQTLGCGPAAGLDWHFDIQHLAAQVRQLRELTPGENVVLACVESEGLAWPAWKRRTADAPARARRVVERLKGWLPAAPDRVTLTGHSGGGSFLFAYVEGKDAIPAEVDRVAFLDANYAFDADPHAAKLLAWLKADPARRLDVIAYDDRNITLNGKPVVGPTGGTFRATGRMLDRFAKDAPFAESKAGPFAVHTAMGGQMVFRVHPNADNKILHTALVGEMNGLLAVTAPGGKWGTFGGPRAYAKWVQPAPGIPPRPADAPGGAAFMKQVEALPPADREEAIAKELIRGNLPDFLRTFRTVTVTAKDHTAAFDVMPDYLAVGSDADFVRVPMTPTTAARVADAFGCALPTRKIVDEVYRAADVKLDPRPMTEAREAVATFVRHHAIIEGQRAGKALGPLVAGIKKDIVVTNRLAERPNRVAIYGWHKPDGAAIQPLTIVHVNWYVDYSHGARLMRREVRVDGKPADVRHVLHAAEMHRLLSDEGPLLRPAY